MKATLRIGSVAASMALSGALACLACGAPAEDDTTSGAGAFTGDDKAAAVPSSPAKVTTKTVSSSAATCKIDLKWPVADAGDSSANAAIAKAMAVPAAADICKDVPAGSSVKLAGGFTVLANDNGILSINVTWTSELSSAARPMRMVSVFTFDLATGKQLQPRDLVTTTGLDRIEKDCAKTLVAGAPSLVDPTEKGPCAAALAAPASAPTNIEVTKDGLHLMLDLEAPYEALGEKGVKLSWKDLGSSLKPVLTDYAAAHEN